MNVYSNITHNNQKGETAQISSDEWINKIWYSNATEYYSAIKRSNVLTYTMTWMNL
jgi:hypothetical protein